MAISIDTVYQRVLALANKEQRGYITPQEFNLFANQAQQEIFEQYFYDLNQVSRIPGNDTVYADVDDMLEEKLQMFENSDTKNVVNSYNNVGLDSVIKSLPSYIYRVYKVELNNINCEMLNTKDFNDCRSGGPLTKPSSRRPIVNIRKNVIRCVGGGGFFAIPTEVFYFKKPEKVQWGYFVINDTALHDTSAAKTTNFELHQSEESELVYRILAFAGIAIEKPQLTQVAAGLQGAQIQQEKQ